MSCVRVFSMNSLLVLYLLIIHGCTYQTNYFKIVSSKTSRISTTTTSIDDKNIETRNRQRNKLPENNIEKQLRSSIRYQNWTQAIDVIKLLNNDSLSSMRSPVYIIVETCRRIDKSNTILSLLQYLSPEHLSQAREDDVMPFLSDDNMPSNDVNIALQIIFFLTQQNVKFTAKAYSTLLKKIVPVQQQNKAVQTEYVDVDLVLSLCGSRNIIPDTILLNSAIDAYIRNNMFEKALYIWEQTFSNKSQFPYFLYVAYPQVFNRTNELNNDISVNNTVNSAIQNSLSVFISSLTQYNVKSNIRTINTLLKGFRYHDTTSLPYAANMMSSSLSSTTTTTTATPRSIFPFTNLGTAGTTAAINHNNNNHNGFELALKLFQWLLSQNNNNNNRQLQQNNMWQLIRPDKITINTLVDVAVSHNKLLIAENLITRSINMSITDSTARTKQQSVDSSVSSGTDTTAAVQGVAGTVSTGAGVEAYTSLLYGYAIQQDAISATRVFDQMISRKVEPNYLTYTAYVTALVSGGVLGKAEQILGQFIYEYLKSDELLTNDATASSRSSSGNINININERKPTMTIYGSEIRRTLTDVWNAYISSLCKLSVQSTSTDFYQPLDFDYTDYSAVATDTSTSTTSTYNYNNDDDDEDKNSKYLLKAQMSLLKMKEYHIHVDIYTLNSYLQALLESNSNTKVIDALMVYKALQEGNEYPGIHPDKYTFSILFTALGKYGYIDLALELFRSTVTSLNKSNSRNKKIQNNNHNDIEIDVAVINSLLHTVVSSKTPLRCIDLFYEFFNISLLTKSSAATNTMSDIKRTTNTNSNNVNTGSATTSNENSDDSVNEKYVPNIITFTILFAAIANSLKYEIKSYNMYDATTSTSWTVDQSESKILQQSGLVTSKDGDRFYEQSNTISSNNNSNNFVKTRSMASTSSTSSSSSSSSSQLKINKIDTTSIPIKTLYTSRDVDTLLRVIYRYMRYILCIQPDAVCVAVVKAIFQVHAKMQSEKYISVVSPETAKLIFEDLVTLGWSPSKLPTILKTCDYSNTILKDLTQDDADNKSQFIKRLRSSPASNKIFKKYQWNEMKSGWNPFF